MNARRLLHALTSYSSRVEELLGRLPELNRGRSTAGKGAEPQTARWNAGSDDDRIAQSLSE